MVSIIILNWNGEKYIFDCIESIQKQTYKKYEVVFVDNASSDCSLTKVQEQYPNFIYVKNESNCGFAKGMNIGITNTKGDLVLFLNTDVYLDSNYLEECVKAFKDPSVGCAGGWEYIWHQKKKTNIPAFEGTYGIKLHLQVSSSKQNSKDAFGVSGSFPIFRKETINDVISLTGSFFDERFETGWEDTDLRFLLAYTRWKTCFVDTTKAWHVGSAAANEKKSLYKKNKQYQIRIFRNRFYIQYKYVKDVYPFWNLFLHIVNLWLPFYLLFFHPKSIFLYLLGYREYRKNKPLFLSFKQELLPFLLQNKHNIKKYIIGL